MGAGEPTLVDYAERPKGVATKGKKDGDAKTESAGYDPPTLANPGNLIKCLVGGGLMGDDIAHENEAPFPESLVEFFIKSFCPENGIVCDPHSGSGTTCKVAVQWGRRFIGCDVRQSQVDLAERRMERQGTSLFE